MPKITDPNALKALYQLKEEIAKELEIDSSFSKANLSDSVNNIYLGGQLGGNMVKRMIEISEKNLINKQ